MRFQKRHQDPMPSNCRARAATPPPSGQHYVLNGEKMWITNAGFADLLPSLPRWMARSSRRFSSSAIFPDLGSALGAQNGYSWLVHLPDHSE
jgi:alkylation response protein AidB-like acyl-CoA dehydrogenase